jgi:hypothetical protein
MTGSFGIRQQAPQPQQPPSHLRAAERSAPSPDAAVDPPSPREAALQSHVRDLEKQLAIAKAAVDMAEGSPLTAPPDLPERFKQQALFDSLTRALQRLNPKAEVTSVDCTEYPCIVYASGMSDIEMARHLKDSAELQPYTSAHDHVLISIIDSTFAFSAMPKDDPNYGADSDRRLTSRINQMAYAGKSTH